MSVKTRFAPSPTGLLHVGNVRTALFNALLARREGGTFLLRIEDTDAERSRPEFVDALKTDLRWLGLQWQEGPEAEGENGPYLQSERTATYAEYYGRLIAEGHAYPCFCTPQELAVERKTQQAAGRAPRYGGRCARLAPEVAEERIAAGTPYTLRFHVPDDQVIGFDDQVRGPQRFAGADIGDFIIRRADGSAAFFFSNAVDDALMGVTHVLRGEDHLANTPRQLLLLETLGLRAPHYGHISLIVGADGAPLSKRLGSLSMQALREDGYLPEAIDNHLARLGHVYGRDDLMSLDELAAEFDTTRLGRAPARFDPDALSYWQGAAVAAASPERLGGWLDQALNGRVPANDRTLFIEAIRENIRFPADAARWAEQLFGEAPELSGAAREAIAAAGPAFFAIAVEELDRAPEDFRSLAKAVGVRTGTKGKGLFMPLRAALTGETGGPEMGRVFPLIGPERARRRLAAWAG